MREQVDIILPENSYKSIPNLPSTISWKLLSNQRFVALSPIRSDCISLNQQKGGNYKKKVGWRKWSHNGQIQVFSKGRALMKCTNKNWKLQKKNRKTKKGKVYSLYREEKKVDKNVNQHLEGSSDFKSSKHNVNRAPSIRRNFSAFPASSNSSRALAHESRSKLVSAPRMCSH